MRAALVAVFALCLTGPAARADETTDRLAQLEARVAALEAALQQPAAPPAPVPAPFAATPSAARDESALAAYRAAIDLEESGDTEAAREALGRVIADYGDTRVAEPALRRLETLSVVGRTVPGLAVDTWLQGSFDLPSHQGATLVVFFEAWCPHCARELPLLQKTWKRLADDGLAVVGLTKQTRDTTDAQVRGFLRKAKVKFPVGHEDGSMTSLFGVSGVPAAAVVLNGVVAWRGHPAQITDDMLAGWLAAARN